MIDESQGTPKEQSAANDGTNTETPVLLEPHSTSANKKKASKYAQTAARYANVTFDCMADFIWLLCKWMWKILKSNNFWMVSATVVIAISTSIYTFYANKQWHAMDSQLKEMQAQRQPWVGIEDNVIAVAPSPSFFFGIPPRVVDYPNIEITANYVVKNFGAGPAFSEFDDITVMADREGTKPIDEMKSWCRLAEVASRAGAETSGLGEMLLPGARKQSTLGTNPQLKIKQTHIERLWIFVCVAYQDSGQKEIHHSMYMYLTKNGGNPIALPEPHSQWTYLPITGATLVSATAD
jgi:hypothetical protein